MRSELQRALRVVAAGLADQRTVGPPELTDEGVVACCVGYRASACTILRDTGEVLATDLNRRRIVLDPLRADEPLPVPTEF